MKLPRIALVAGHPGPGRTLAFAALARAYGADAVAAAVGRGLGRGSADVPRLEIGAASRIRGAAYASYVEATLPRTLSRAAALGLSEYAYFGVDSFEPYQALGAPLPAPLPGAQPDISRPWVLIEALSPVAARALLAGADLGLRDAQLHVVMQRAGSMPSLSPEVVRWMAFPATTAAVLGRCYAVVAPDGPLLWDAIRLDRHAIAAAHVDVLARDRRIAATLPPVLLGDGRSLVALVQAGPEGFAEHVLDLDARREALEQRLAEPAEEQRDLERARRRWRKFRQEPTRFLKESRSGALRRAGELLERSGLGRRGG